MYTISPPCLGLYSPSWNFSEPWFWIITKGVISQPVWGLPCTNSTQVLGTKHPTKYRMGRYWGPLRGLGLQGGAPACPPWPVRLDDSTVLALQIQGAGRQRAGKEGGLTITGMENTPAGSRRAKTRVYMQPLPGNICSDINGRPTRALVYCWESIHE